MADQTLTIATPNRQTTPVTSLDNLGERPIQLVTFDLYDTLIELKPRRWERLHAALGKLGIDADADTLREADIVAEDFYTIENGGIPIRDRTPEERDQFRLTYMERWLSAAGVPHDSEFVERVRHTYRAEFEAHALGGEYRPFDEVVPALVKLRQAGVKRAVISNADVDVTELCTRLAFAHEMDAIITSALVGYEKPDPRTYHAALEHPSIQVAAEDALHIGDQPKSDVIGAIAIGMRAALIDRYHRHQDHVHPAVRVPNLLALSEAVVRHNAALR